MSTHTRLQPRPVSPARWARLRLVSDEGLLRLIRQGDETAFDVLVRRYDNPIFAFCKHMLGSWEDAEDAMQEVWTAAHRSMLRDDRDLTIRAWLYAIARNRCLNAMRSSGPRPSLVPVDMTDEAEGGVVYQLPTAGSAADHLDDRERFRVLVGDIQELPENQRTALVLHELDALSYDEIAGVLNVTPGAVKSLLVRARMGLTESAEARDLNCDDVRLELSAVAQRVGKLRASSKAHVRRCEDCTEFERRLKRTNRSLTAAMSPAPVILLWLQKLGLGKLTGGGIAAGSATGGGSGLVTAGGGAFALKAAATVAAAGLATAGAGEVHHLRQVSRESKAGVSASTARSAGATQLTALSAVNHTPAATAATTARAAGEKATALNGVTVVPISGDGSSSSSSQKTSVRATHASGGVHVVKIPQHQPSRGRPQVQVTEQTTAGRPTVSAPADSTAATPTTPAPTDATGTPPAADTTSGSTPAPQVADSTPAPAG